MHRVSMMKPGSWRAACHIGKLSTSSKLAGSFPEQQPPATSEYSVAMRSTSDFARRHIGPTDAQTSAMLEYLELEVTSSLPAMLCSVSVFINFTSYIICLY